MPTKLEAAREKLRAADQKLHDIRRARQDKEDKEMARSTFDPETQRKARDLAALRNEFSPPSRPDFGGRRRRRRTRRGRKSRSTRRR